MLQRYMNNEVEIEAAQWNGSQPNATDIINWILHYGGSTSYRCGGQCCDNELAILVTTPETYFKVIPQDFVIRDMKTNEFHWCKPGAFLQKYTQIPEGHL